MKPVPAPSAARAFLLLATFAVGSSLFAQQAPAGAAAAVVRVPSHGGSATVISTGPGYTYLLSAAHLFFVQHSEQIDPRLLSRVNGQWVVHKLIALDVPVPPYSTPQAKCPEGGIRVLAVDAEHDLSLWYLPDGPLPYVCPVAPADHQCRQGLSVGYDEMRTPSQQRLAQVIVSEDGHGREFTAQRPWHGRSGGALIDAQAGVLIGVCSGYETQFQRRGVYVSLPAIHAFMGRWRAAAQTNPWLPPAAQVHAPAQRAPQPQYAYPLGKPVKPFFAPEFCPGGT